MPHEDSIKALQKDIAVIKDAIRANNGYLRRVLAAPALGGFFFASGLVAIVLPLAWHFARSSNNTRASFWLLLAITIAAIIGLGLWKIKSFQASVRKVAPGSTWLDIIKELSDHPLFYNQPLIMLIAAAAAVAAGTSGNHYLIPAALAAGMGVVFMQYNAAFLLGDYGFLSLWLMLYSGIVLFMPWLPPLVSTAIGFGGGFLLYGCYCLFCCRQKQ